MAVLAAGANAPDIRLNTTDGKAFSLHDERDAQVKTPVVAAFFKVGCPTCQYALPFLERVFKAYPVDRVRIIGISQDNADATSRFMKEYGLTFPVLLDDVKKYPVSNAYQLVNVPSTFVISQGGAVALASIGWVKDEFQQLNEMVAKAAGMPPAQIFKASEQVKDFKAG